ncbi:unnamed protein product [Tetraodon nigroviridis]|uniref:Chromosome 7 SCAF15001, whole genome shotgun sequence n=1 Tax=Tetraodon nigroviridis TaxID=99883 RepID=Q4RS12_TETNG|nr:unnamed protein product [Tetraodon nigroviridis]
MEGQGRLIGGLALVLLGVLGVCVACGLPMWRETSFVGANIVSAQSVWDGLWLHCVHQATGQMQCKRHTTSNTLTSDIQAGRALTLISILAGILGFLVALLGGGVANCSGRPPDQLELQGNYSSRKKACLLGGGLCVLAGVLCLVSASWSAALTITVYNDPLVTEALKREVGSSVYIGWVSSLLLLLGGALICIVCGQKERPLPPPQLLHEPNSSVAPFSVISTRPTTPRSDPVRSNSSRMSRVVQSEPRTYSSLKRAPNVYRVYSQSQWTQPGSYRS